MLLVYGVHDTLSLVAQIIPPAEKGHKTHARRLLNL
jgi:hypothetical protein